MMRAAIYARFSTDMQRDQSIEDQVLLTAQIRGYLPLPKNIGSRPLPPSLVDTPA